MPAVVIWLNLELENFPPKNRSSEMKVFLGGNSSPLPIRTAALCISLAYQTREWTIKQPLVTWPHRCSVGGHVTEKANLKVSPINRADALSGTKDQYEVGTPSNKRKTQQIFMALTSTVQPKWNCDSDTFVHLIKTGRCQHSHRLNCSI